MLLKKLMYCPIHRFSESVRPLKSNSIFEARISKGLPDPLHTTSLDPSPKSSLSEALQKCYKGREICCSLVLT
jgi:hypothetical protein